MKSDAAERRNLCVSDLVESTVSVAVVDIANGGVAPPAGEGVVFARSTEDSEGQDEHHDLGTTVQGTTCIIESVLCLFEKKECTHPECSCTSCTNRGGTSSTRAGIPSRQRWN